MQKRGKVLLIITFFSFFLVYLASSAGKTPYDYFVKLADAFIHGRYWLNENPPWLNELIPAGPNKFYTAYPPLPAILLIPLVAIFGKEFPQQIFAHIVGASFAITWILIALKIKKDSKLAIWTGILASLGTITWFMSSVGSVWYLGQMTAALFLSLAIYEGLTKKRVFLVGLFVGAAFLSRLHTILSLPFFIYLLRDKLKNPKNIFSLGLAIISFIIFDALYNLVRFGVPWDKGYLLIPGVLSEPWFSKGIMNPGYIGNNLKVAFASLPTFSNHFPFIKPSWSGLAIWITTPAFIFSFRASLKETLVKFGWISTLLIFLFVALHGSTGFAQFGYRFAVDFYPFLFLLTIKGVARDKLSWQYWLLLFIGVIVNLWGVIWINKFGWVGF